MIFAYGATRKAASMRKESLSDAVLPKSLKFYEDPTKNFALSPRRKNAFRSTDALPKPSLDVSTDLKKSTAENYYEES